MKIVLTPVIEHFTRTLSATAFYCLFIILF